MHVTKSLFIFSSTILLSFSSLALEVDNFTQRYQSLPDSNSVLSAEMNRRLQIAVDTANDKNVPCDQTGKKKVRDIFYGKNAGSGFFFMIGKIEAFAEDSDTVAKHSSTIANSVYSKDYNPNFSFRHSPLSSSININGHYIGTDKLGHFIDQGHDSYAEVRNVSTAYALKAEKHEEKGIYGGTSSGVISYGDLSANYSGIKFWENFSNGPNPYLKCVNSQWTLARSFNFADYVNDSWDEAINCSEFPDPKQQAGFLKNLKALEEKSGGQKKFTCPVDESACAKLRGVIPDNYASYFISPKCMKIMMAASKYNSAPSGKSSSSHSNGQGGSK
jgi:hypothetical protein